MTRENKIPLFLTVIALGFLIHWAIGFVQKHKKTEALSNAPIQAYAKEAPLARAPANVVVNSTDPTPPEETVAIQKKPVAAAQPDADSIMPHDEQSKATGRPVNRKLLGLIEASGKKG
jgi:hypothetical protein